MTVRSTTEIITDEQVETVHANANFGDTQKRAVVDEGVLKYALGFSSGHTQMVILQEHGLLSCARDTQRLTKKGQEYLRALFGHLPPKACIEKLISPAPTAPVIDDAMVERAHTSLLASDHIANGITKDEIRAALTPALHHKDGV